MSILKFLLSVNVSILRDEKEAKIQSQIKIIIISLNSIFVQIKIKILTRAWNIKGIKKVFPLVLRS